MPVVLNGAVAVMTTNSGDSLGISGNITGAFPITVTGPGTLTLTGANSFTTLSANGSIVNVGNGVGGSLGTGAVTLANSAILNFNTNTNYNYGQNITGAGTVSQIGSGTTTVGAVSGVLGVNVSSGALVTTSINQSGGINVTGSGRLTASGPISGAGKLTVNTTGAVSLAASNTYTGGTEIDAGSVTLNGVAALPTNSVLAVNGGVLDLNAKSIAINNILDQSEQHRRDHQQRCGRHNINDCVQRQPGSV